MNLLYVSCHSILEYDELKLFHGMGINVFSHGRYIDPMDAEGDDKRPLLPELPFYPELFKLGKACAKESLDPGLIEWADTIVFMGKADLIPPNWKAMEGKRVIWRAIGQNTPALERLLSTLKGLVKVRYSPTEAQIPDYAGSDALCRFYKDEDEFGGWTGTDKVIISIGQMVKHRNNYCGLTWFEQATEGLPRSMIGPHNEDIDTMPTAELSYELLKCALRNARVFFYTGTYPAPYTLGFVEAWITGIPVVAIGQGLRDRHFRHEPGLWEIPGLIENGGSGYWSDEIRSLRKICAYLLDDKAMAQEMGDRGRAAAIPLFGKQAAIDSWTPVLS